MPVQNFLARLPKVLGGVWRAYINDDRHDAHERTSAGHAITTHAVTLAVWHGKLNHLLGPSSVSVAGLPGAPTSRYSIGGHRGRLTIDLRILFWSLTYSGRV